MSSNRVIGKTLNTIEFEWLINLSDEILETKGCLESPTFSFLHGSWYCVMYPKGDENAEYISLYLHKKTTPYEMNVHFCLEMILNGMQLVKLEDKDIFKTEDDNWGWSKYLLRSKVLDQWSKKTEECSQLTVKIRISNKDPPPEEDTFLEKRKEGKDNVTPKLNAVDKMCHDLKQLLLSEEGSDVTLQVQDQQFKAHSSILTSRSSVFAAMLRHDMKEKATGVVNVEDCEPSSFPVLLEFMYCCSIEKLSVGNVFDLYTSADKYDIEDLKIECFQFIKKNLSIETFCETVKLTLQHPESNLLDMAIEFFARNMKEIIVTVKWQVFLAENPIQSNEILIKASAHWQLKP